MNRRGRRAAARVGRFLTEAHPTLDRVWSSTAARARETAERLLEASELEAPMELFDGIYGASPGTLLSLLRIAPDRDQQLLMVGHEPSIGLLGGALLGGSAIRMPTAALVRLDLAVESWAEVRPGIAQLAWHVTPKVLARAGRAGSE